MDERFINITGENIAQEHLCCIIRSKKDVYKRQVMAMGMPPMFTLVGTPIVLVSTT